MLWAGCTLSRASARVRSAVCATALLAAAAGVNGVGADDGPGAPFSDVCPAACASTRKLEFVTSADELAKAKGEANNCSSAGAGAGR
jgi:hypothetical protein